MIIGKLHKDLLNRIILEKFMFLEVKNLWSIFVKVRILKIKIYDNYRKI